MSTGFVSLASGVVALVLGAVFYAARFGFENPRGPILETVGLSLFLLGMPEAWRRLMARFECERQWFAAPGLAAVLGLALAVFAGVFAAEFRGLIWAFALLGAVFFTVAAARCVSAAPQRASLLIAGSAGFGLWTSALAWGYGYMNPLFVESLAARTAPKTVVDTMFHASIANMIGIHGQPSTGLDGVVPLRYHVGSHWLFVQLAKLLDSTLLDFYQLAFPVLMLPLLFASLLWFAAALTHGGEREGPAATTLPGFWFWAVFLAGVIGIFPVEAQAGLAVGWWRPISESYTVSLIGAFGLLSGAVHFLRNDATRAALWSPSRVLFLLVVAPLVVTLCGLTKSSTMFLLVAASGYAFFRLRLYRDPVWRLAVPLIVALSLFATWLLRIPGFAKPSPFHFVATYVKVGWRPLWLVGYFIWVWLFAAVRLRGLGVRTLGELRDRLRERRLLDVELLVVVAAAGAVPGLLVAIGGQSTGYFSDPQRWLAIAFLLSVTAPLAGLSVERRSIWDRSLAGVATWIVALALAGVVAANGYSLLKRFAKANIETRRRLLGAGAVPELFRGGRAGAVRLSTHPEYQLLKALRRLDDLPPAEKAGLLLFVPKTEQLYWKLLPECLAPSFIGPALSGLPMLSGLPEPECEGQRLGYWTYRLRQGGWGEEVAPGKECERALHLGFRRVLRLQRSTTGVALVEAICDGR